MKLLLSQQEKDEFSKMNSVQSKQYISKAEATLKVKKETAINLIIIARDTVHASTKIREKHSREMRSYHKREIYPLFERLAQAKAMLITKKQKA